MCSHHGVFELKSLVVVLNLMYRLGLSTLCWHNLLSHLSIVAFHKSIIIKFKQELTKKCTYLPKK